jgi:hypothetical protein
MYALSSLEERRKGETHVLVRLTGLVGVAWRWARAHNVHVNSPSKSDTKPHRSVAFFCHLFLL